MHDIKVTQTDTGSHGIHWQVIFDKETDTKQLMDRLVKAIETGKKLAVNDILEVITDPLIRGIIHNNSVITGFPYLKGLKYEQFELASIAEWSHAENLEAIINVSHISDRDISFFATDYAIHEKIYKTQKTLSINVVGLIYNLYEFSVQEWNQGTDKISFHEDFCAYFPKSKDEIEFIGRIQHTQKHSLGEISGHLITVGIAPEFSMEFFIAGANLAISIENNKHVRGIAWIQGTLEK